MTKKIFRAIFLTAFGLCLGTLLLILFYLYHYFTDLERSQLQEQTYLVAQAVELEGQAYLDQWSIADVRVTWVQADGGVVFDSEIDWQQLGNHAGRKEIQEAFETGYGASIRYSSSLTEQLIYTAQKLADGSVIRLAQKQDTILLLLWNLLPAVGLLLVLSVVFSLQIARFTSKKLLAPLEQIDLSHPLSQSVYPELSPLLHRLDQHQEALLEKEQLLQQKREEFDTIISKIREGMVIVDQEGKLVSYNTAAAQLFGLESQQKGILLGQLYRHQAFQTLLDEVLSGKSRQDWLALVHSQYRVVGRPIWSDQGQTGAALLFFDETGQMALETMRKEFTANVSHELRTPLQIMMGYSEILQTQDLAQQSLNFVQKIHKESRRMLSLIEDLLSLAQLDEIHALQKQEIGLKAFIADLLAGLEEQAAKAEVSLYLTGEDVTLWANPGLLHSILYNLCDNAIKYNQEQGRVQVDLAEREGQVCITIQDTGIGISHADQQRVFERFYRADKSRSKMTGGTGLGLSIVKHGLQLHGATIEVDSQVGRGTSMVLSFPQ